MSASASPADGAGPGPAGPLTVGHLMRPAATTVEPDDHVASAAYLMKRANDSALVVTTDVEGRLPLAVITDADVSQAVADGRNLNDTRIHQLRLPAPLTVDPDTPVTAAAEQMLEMSLQHVTVVRDGRLLGLVDIAAVCRALLRGSAA